MITNSYINYRNPAGEIGDSSLGNMLFKIAGIIGIATNNGYNYGFPEWVNQQYFVNPLPKFTGQLKKRTIQGNFLNIDFGFMGFDYPDNIDLNGEFGTEQYFSHCEGLIRHYFEVKPQCEPIKDTIMMHYRDYKGNTSWNNLGRDYYEKALSKMPDKRVVVVTDNIDVAFNQLGGKYEYTSNSPIVDFYLLANADYLVMANSTFSWWGAWLSKAFTVAPKDWYSGVLKDAPIKHIYLSNWLIV